MAQEAGSCVLNGSMLIIEQIVRHIGWRCTIVEKKTEAIV